MYRYSIDRGTHIIILTDIILSILLATIVSTCAYSSCPVTGLSVI